MYHSHEYKHYRMPLPNTFWLDEWLVRHQCISQESQHWLKYVNWSTLNDTPNVDVQNDHSTCTHLHKTQRLYKPKLGLDVLSQLLSVTVELSDIYFWDIYLKYNISLDLNMGWQCSPSNTMIKTLFMSTYKFLN